MAWEPTTSKTTASDHEAGKSQLSLLQTLNLRFNSLSETKHCLILFFFFVALNLATHSGKYVPTSDGAYYLCIARSLYKGHGFTYNGNPTAIVAPGWPGLLAGAMHISQSFFFLGMISVLSLSGATVIWYRVLRQSCNPAQAFVGMLACGMLHEWYTSASNFFSEAPFLLCLGGAVLVAQGIADKKSLVTRLPLLVLLCAATVLFRWVGLASSVIIVASVMRGNWEFSANRRWVCAVIILATISGTFYFTKMALTCLSTQNNPLQSQAMEIAQQKLKQNESLPEESRDNEQEVKTEVALQKVATTDYHPSMPEPPASLTRGVSKTAYVPPIAIDEDGSYKLNPFRLSTAGQWICALFYAPAALGKSSRLIGNISNVIGFGMWLCLICWAIQRARKGDWLWLGAILYCTILIMRWGHVVQRYIMPVAPLLLLGVWNGMRIVLRNLPRQLGNAAVFGFLSSFLLLNGFLLTTDVVIARSSSFGEYYYAGYSLKLVQAANYLQQHQVEDGQVAISGDYLNLNLKRPNSYAERQLCLLIDRQISAVPSKIMNSDSNKIILKWAKKNRVSYYLYRTPVSPWRVWHFRMPMLQAWITGKQVEEQPDWILYDLSGGKFTPITLPVEVAWPTTVPETVFR